jgi:hypothetical protein
MTTQNDRADWTPRDHARAAIVEAAIERLTGQDLETLTAMQLARAELDLDLLVLDPAQPRNDGSPEARRHALASAVAREYGRRRDARELAASTYRAMFREVRIIYRELRPDIKMGL